jgi:hypothetical protein
LIFQLLFPASSFILPFFILTPIGRHRGKSSHAC